MSTSDRPRKPIAPGAGVGYSSTPLPRKLGIRPADTVALAGAPPGFEKLLQPLPEKARTTRGRAASTRVLLLFVRTPSELQRRFSAASKRVAPGGKLWICWPKQGTDAARDLNGNDVRAFGLARRWVDFKVCAVDASWSGLCFSRRAADA